MLRSLVFILFFSTLACAFDVRSSLRMSSRGPFSIFSSAKPGKKAPAAPPIVIRPSYNVPIGSAAISALSLATHSYLPGAFFGLIGALLFVQTGRVRFQFDDEALEVKVSKGEQALQDSGENFAVGGKNRWAYDSVTKWFFIPSPAFPVLVYFTERQTDPAKDQLHLFPVIMDGKQLFETMQSKIGDR